LFDSPRLTVGCSASGRRRRRRRRRRLLASPCPSFYSSVCPHGTTQPSLEEFSWNLIWVFVENLSRKFKFSYTCNMLRITAALHEQACARNNVMDLTRECNGIQCSVI
jgi:hypothetical protein